MGWTLFSTFEFSPLWRSQGLDQDHLEESLVLQILGLSFSFWLIPIVMLSTFSELLLFTLDRPSQLLQYFSSWWIQSILAMLVSPMVVTLLIRYTDLLGERGLTDILMNWRLELEEDLSLVNPDMEPTDVKIRTLVIITALIMAGSIAGVFYVLMFIIPMYLLYILIAFILVNFLSLSLWLLLISTIISWILCIRWLLLWRLQSRETEQVDQLNSNYQMAERNLDIIASNREPIVCPECRSFISAEKRSCPVCGEDIL